MNLLIISNCNDTHLVKCAVLRSKFSPLNILGVRHDGVVENYALEEGLPFILHEKKGKGKVHRMARDTAIVKAANAMIAVINQTDGALAPTIATEEYLMKRMLGANKPVFVSRPGILSTERKNY
tara:strand:+ start:813 stop:1184 length:372 start_codon:yes stop_codon:yes gene_type:complete